MLQIAFNTLRALYSVVKSAQPIKSEANDLYKWYKPKDIIPVARLDKLRQSEAPKLLNQTV
jgi:hypothetical protein